MSNKSVQEFLDQVQKDESLRAELDSVLAAEDKSKAVTELAVSKGYEFSDEELLAEVQKRQEEFQQREEAGELTDDELEAVAGGRGVKIGGSLKFEIDTNKW